MVVCGSVINCWFELVEILILLNMLGRRELFLFFMVVWICMLWVVLLILELIVFSMFLKILFG